MRTRMLLVLAAITAAVVAVNILVERKPLAPTETLGQRAERECAGKPDPAWCRDQMLLQRAVQR